MRFVECEFAGSTGKAFTRIPKIESREIAMESRTAFVGGRVRNKSEKQCKSGGAFARKFEDVLGRFRQDVRKLPGTLYQKSIGMLYIGRAE